MSFAWPLTRRADPCKKQQHEAVLESHQRIPIQHCISGKEGRALSLIHGNDLWPFLVRLLTFSNKSDTYGFEVGALILRLLPLAQICVYFDLPLSKVCIACGFRQRFGRFSKNPT